MADRIPTITKYVSELSPHPDNYNVHPKGQIAQLAESLTTFGQFKNLVAWTCPENMTTPDGVELHEGVCYILAGHGLWLAAMQAGLDQLEVKDYSGLSYEMALSLLMVDNAAPLGNEPDTVRLAALLERTRAIVADKPGLAGMLETLRQKAGVNGKGQAGNDAGPQIDKAQQLKEKWGVELGQLWQLGGHRLICGDCTDKATVERVMGGGLARMMITDPPYKGQLGGSPFPKDAELRYRTNKMKTSIEDLYDFDANAFLLGLGGFCKRPAAFFFFCNKVLVPVYLNFAINEDMRWYILTWHKPNFIPMNNGKYFPDTEYIVKVNDKGALFITGLPKAEVSYGTYWIEEVSSGNGLHPTVKPLKPISDCIQICSNRDDIVCDPFLGSGTTIIACQNLNRRCRAIEIDPGYVAVSLQRWADLTGLTPTLVSG